MKKVVGSTLDLSTKAVFSLGKYQLKNMGWKPRFCYSTYKKREKFLLRCFPPPPRDQTNPFAYSCSFTFQTSYKNGMFGHGGERCQNAQKHFIIKTN